MQIWIALLRGVNVGGHGKLPMAEFRSMLSGLGYSNPQTYVQSGNAIFASDEPASAISEAIASGVEAQFSFRPEVMLLTAQTLQDALNANPFPATIDAPTTLHLLFGGAPDLAAIRAAATSGEEAECINGITYFHTPNGYGKSRLAANIARHFDAPITARNLRSCVKIAEMSQA
ncbi:MAG: DUF1697 domain-containing protein [Paracoccaceae bacterium]